MDTLSQEDIGYWLKIARESMNLKQEGASELLKIPRSAISLIEAGKRSVTSIELDQFAKLYYRPVSFFLRKKSEKIDQEEPLTILLRAKNVRSEDRPDLIRLLEFFKKYASLERMVLGGINYEIPEYLVGNRQKRYQSVLDEGEHLAMDERGRLGLGNAPISDIYSILEREGIKVYKTVFSEESNISGCFFFTKEVGPCIAINSAQRLERNNFTAVHEYCHFLRDMPSLNDYACDLRSIGTQEEIFEIRANAFAANFLMPTDGVNDFLKGLGISKRHFPTVDQIVKTQRYFKVSYQAMLFRLLNLKWLDEEHLKLYKEFKPTEIAKQLGFDTGKPDADFKFPPRYIYLTIEAYRKGKISLEKLSELLSLSRNDATSLLKSLKVEIKLGSKTEEDLFQEIGGA